jgi:hypothetical protein
MDFGLFTPAEVGEHDRVEYDFTPLYTRAAQPPSPAPAGLPALFTEIRHLLGRLSECFDEKEEEHKDIGAMLSALSAQPFCPKCGPAVMSAEWRCCKCGSDMRDGLPPIAYSSSTKCGAPLDADGVDKCERTKGHTGVCGLDPV